MKIAFPLLNEKELSNDFSHALHIGIYNEELDHLEIISITELEKMSKVTNFIDLMISLGLSSVVSPHYSYMSLRIFKENRINTLKAVGFCLDQNIKLHRDRELIPFDVYKSLINDDCVSDCGSCGTSCSSN
jgi:predicted Fe-Mo cluster-binding NifX family protein